MVVVDIMGQALAVGDQVVFGLAGTMTLQAGEIVKINEKTVKIKYFGYHPSNWGNKEEWNEAQRTFDNVVKVS